MKWMHMVPYCMLAYLGPQRARALAGQEGVHRWDYYGCHRQSGGASCVRPPEGVRPDRACAHSPEEHRRKGEDVLPRRFS